MDSIITNGIEISVSNRYYSEHSDPKSNHYFFVYEVAITNKTDYTVKLIKRHWDIVDGYGENRVVDGDGVVGETPVIAPNETFIYNSGCNFSTEFGKMSGYYVMQKMLDSSTFHVLIPEFLMFLPAKLN